MAGLSIPAAVRAGALKPNKAAFLFVPGLKYYSFYRPGI